MILTCEKCLRRYSVAEEMLRGRALKLRCKGCGQIIAAPSVAAGGPAAARAGAPSRSGATPAKGASWRGHGLSAVATPAEAGASWFAMIKGRQSGPFRLQEVQGRLDAGEIGRQTYVWREGMTEWKRAGELADLSRLFDPRRAGAGDAEAHPRRESFEEAAAGSGPVVTRPLAELKLSPSATAAALPAKEPATPAPAPADLTSAPGEQTRFFIAEAGVDRRNPPWKIAAFGASLIAVPALALYLLTALKVGPLVVTRIDSAGNEVRESVFARDGVAGLRALLSGRQQRTRPARTPRPAAKPAPAGAQAAEAPAASPPRPAGSAELRAFYADGTKTDVGPALRARRERTEEGAAGRAPAEVAKVVAQTQPAFQFCIEQEMKKNPFFKGGKVSINAVIGGSGIVKQVAISRPDIDGSRLGECLKAKAKRMVFAAGAGDDTEVQIPLILTSSL